MHVFVDKWEQSGVLIDYIQLGKPNQNTFLERLNRILRNKYLYL